MLSATFVPRDPENKTCSGSIIEVPTESEEDVVQDTGEDEFGNEMQEEEDRPEEVSGVSHFLCE